MTDVLEEFPAVVVGGTEIVVDQTRPVAAIVAPDRGVRFATWPDVAVGPVEPTATLLPAPDAAWVHYPPSTLELMDGSHDRLLVGRDSPAVRIGADGAVAVVRLGGRRALGATSAGIWSAPDRPQLLDEGYRGGPMPPGWSDPTELVLTRADGTTELVRIDRHVLGVFEEGGLVRVLVAPTPPIAEPTGGGSTFHHRVSEVDLPADGPLPEGVRFLDRHPDGVGPAADPRRCWWTAHDWALPASPARSIDLRGVAGTRWPLVDLPDAEIADAERAAARWFGDPNGFWGSGAASVPLARGMRDAEVHREDAWPRTRVVVTFRHPHWPAGRLRRSVRVFDDAGRLTSNPYADIHLMEDLETGNLPPVTEARDGVLDA